jgi:hypothetical protein
MVSGAGSLIPCIAALHLLMPLGQIPVAAELAPVKRRRKVFHIVVNSVDEYLVKTTYTYERFAAKKPSASMVWIECPSRRIDEGWEFA